jgi:ribosomal protein S18 acetylase RimI-like enzyme
MINKSSTGIVIRLMEIDDLKKALEIEKQSFPVPWTYDLFFSELTRNRFLVFGTKGTDFILPILLSSRNYVERAMEENY